MTEQVATANKETMGFQTEVKQLLKLMIHSLYSNKEIFLRELISNASDACDKLRFEAIANPALNENDAELKVEIEFDEAAGTLTIRDNGIGMSRQEVIDNIGTIARSGTKDFFQNLTGDQAKDAQLIGQFGVGFYSGFIVAKSIDLITRRAGEPSSSAVRWSSEGEGEFTLEATDKAARGTEVILHLREDDQDLLSRMRLTHIISKYSDHIALPIRMLGETWDEEKKASVSTSEWETVNQASALWVRSKSEISDEQYIEFYKHLSHDWADPVTWTHNRVEGRSEYTQLLYIPAKAPFDLWDRSHKRGLKLYVRRVFIMDDAEQLLPAYLRFVRGVVDSNDLPLNVSREILQESRDVRVIREGCVKRVLSLLEDLAEHQAEKYAALWQEFGRVIKEGVAEDTGNRERIAKLLRFSTTHNDTPEQPISLADYVARQTEGQDKIYYVTADTFMAAKNSPHLEIFRQKGIEVLLLSDRIDEWLVSSLTEFEGKSLVSVARGDLDLGDLAQTDNEESKQQKQEAEEALKPIIERIKATLGDRVKDVRTTARLTNSPACVISDEHDMSGNLQRILKSIGQDMGATKPILELNPTHAIVQHLSIDDPKIDAWAELLLDQALLAEGGQLEDPASFVRRMNELMLSLSK